MADEDEEYYIPLEDQRVFGAGIKRKRIAFVPAASTEPSIPSIAQPSTSNPSSIADRYLSLVLPKSTHTPTPPAAFPTTPAPIDPSPTSPTPLCAVCAQPLSPTHETTLAHQVCLEHSHPPSHLDRSRAGLRYLNSYGWDPDARTGLGANADGRRFPIKPVPKHDTMGLREKEDVEALAARVKIRKAEKKEGVVKKLNAKEVRRKEDEVRKKAEKLRGMFYQNDEVDKYLGEGA